MEDTLAILIPAIIMAFITSVSLIAYRHHEFFLKSYDYLLYIPLGIFLLMQCYGGVLAFAQFKITESLIKHDLSGTTINKAIEEAIESISPSMAVIWISAISYLVFLIILRIVTHHINAEVKES